MTTSNPMPAIKLIVLDLDGTLLNSQHEVSPRTEQAIKAAIEQGVQVTIATGKTYQSARHLIKKLGLTLPGVFIQGLVLQNADGSIRSSIAIDAETMLRAVEYAEAAGIPMAAYSEMRVFCGEHHPLLEILQDHHEPHPEYVGSLQGVIRDLPMQKLFMIGEPEALAAAKRELSTRLGDAASLVMPMPNMLEVLPPGASKGAGLRRLIDELGIDPQHVMAIGDGDNDIEMLRLAGIGVAMGNAMPAVLEVADVVVATHDEDGIAEAIERFVLNK